MLTILNKDHHPKSHNSSGHLHHPSLIEKHIFPEKTLRTSSCCSASSSMGTLPSPSASCRRDGYCTRSWTLRIFPFPVSVWDQCTSEVAGSFKVFHWATGNNKKQLLLYNLYIQAGCLTKGILYNGLLQSPHDWIVQSPTLNDQVLFIAQFIQETFVQSLNLTHHTCISSTGTSFAWPCSE